MCEPHSCLYVLYIMKLYIGFLFLILCLLAVASTSLDGTETAVENVEQLQLRLPPRAENGTKQSLEPRRRITCRAATAYASASTIAVTTSRSLKTATGCTSTVTTRTTSQTQLSFLPI
uniref:Uncharacterized protein n=1 Tax=Glossina austeni TaxID=7395 RepID=A0A1A9V9F7_GLOAU